MEWEGDEGNEPVPAWSCNPVSTRRKPRAASHIRSHKWVDTGIGRIRSYARYRSRDEATSSYMEDTSDGFHTFKGDLLLGRAGKEAKAKANALRTELVKKRKFDKERNADTLMPSKKRGGMYAWRDGISHEMDISKELDADFNLPKIHLMPHWAEQIRRYGALQQ